MLSYYEDVQAHILKSGKVVPVLAQSIHDHHRRLTGLDVLLFPPVLAHRKTPHHVHSGLGVHLPP